MLLNTLETWALPMRRPFIKMQIEAMYVVIDDVTEKHYGVITEVDPSDPYFIKMQCFTCGRMFPEWIYFDKRAIITRFWGDLGRDYVLALSKAGGI